MSHSSLLWTLLPPDSDQVSWLFGTMHIRDDRAHQLCGDLYPLIQQADVFIGEMDLEPPSSQAEMPLYDISQFLSEKKYQKTRRQILKSFGIDIAQVAHLHPLMIMSLISTSGLETEHRISLDEHLWNYAKINGKQVMGLESYEDQWKILHSIDPGPIYKQLADISRRTRSINKSADKSLELYLSGQIHMLYQMSKSSMRHLRKKVIYDRNRHMATVIDHLDHALKYFITAGAGHLSGVTGLLSLLKKAGWQVKPVKSFPTLEKQTGTQ